MVADEKKVIQIVCPKYSNKTKLPIKVGSPLKFYQTESDAIEFREPNKSKTKGTPTEAHIQKENQEENNNYLSQSDLAIKSEHPKAFKRKKETIIEFVQQTQ